MIKIILIIIVCAIAGCASMPEFIDSSEGSLMLHVTGLHSAQNKNSYSEIDFYRVEISASDMSQPVISDFMADSKNGVIENVPSGDGRIVKVSAYNKQSKIIREGEEDSVHVSPGKVSQVDISMEAVPIFANLNNGNVAVLQRLKLKLFSDPSDVLIIENKTGNRSENIADAASNLTEFTVDSATGLLDVVPSGISAGENILRVTSKTTGRFSEIKFRTVNGRKSEPAPLYSGGVVSAESDFISFSRFGYMLNANIRSGVLWPRIVSALLYE